MEILLFFSEELGDKYPKLKGQVHAGWIHAFKKPINRDQLLDPLAEFNFKWTEDEVDWFLCAMQHFVESMSADAREGMGITPEHIKILADGSGETKLVSPNARPPPLSPLCLQLT